MADSDSSLTPEKRLLKLIEGASPKAAEKPAAPKPASPAAAAQAPRKPAARPAAGPNPVNFLAGMVDSFTRFKDSWKNIGKQTPGELNLKQVNILFKVLTACAGVYLLATLAGEMRAGDKKFLESLQTNQHEIAELPPDQTKSFDVSMFEKGPKAEIFVPPGRRQVKQSGEPEQASMQLVEMIKDYKLVGVSINPTDLSHTFCMIEDLKKEMTNFLKVGDSISGLKILKIEPETVVLTRGKEQIELR